MAYRFRLLLTLMLAIGVTAAVCALPLPDSARDDDSDGILLADTDFSFPVRIDSHFHIVPRPARNAFARVRRARVNITSEVHATANPFVLSRLWRRGPPSSSLL